MSSPPPRTVKNVSLTIIRRLFNNSQYLDDIKNGALVPSYVRNSHLSKPETKKEPWCTHSQLIRYLDSGGRWYVEVHQYLRPDNTIGGSGLPDPKRLRLGNRIYIARKKRRS